MADVEQDIQKLLAGELVDINLDTDGQLTPRDVDYVPLVKRTVCYIVMAFVFDEKGRILMIQEAKRSCHGQWYLPAGRVEPGENLIDAVKREVLEEAGLQIESFTVCNLETYGRLDWFRICYIGKVTGGKLKTLAEQDSESLQGGWFPVHEVLNGHVNLRQNDFFKTMKVAQEYLAKSETKRHPPYQIGIKAHKNLIVRPVILKYDDERNIEMLCCCKSDQPRLPCYQLDHREPSFSYSLNHLFLDAFNQPSISTKSKLGCQGLLTLEHCGIPEREHDGLCFTPVCILPPHLHETFRTITNPKYTWHKIKNSNVIDELNHRVFNENLLIPLLT